MVADNAIKDECIKRMKILKLDSKIIDDFKLDDKIYVSDLANDNVAEITSYPMFKIFIWKFEKANKVKIYHIVHTKSKNAEKTFLLYVSSKKEQWKTEKSDISKGYLETYCYAEIRETQVIGVNIADGKIVKVV